MRKLTNGLRLDSEEAFIASLDLEEWSCPGCGEAVSAPRNRRVVERRCMACATDASRNLSRDTRLTIAGVPARYRRPFIEKRPWPHAATPGDDRKGRRVGKLASEWRGNPWAIGFLGLSRTGKTMLATELFWRVLSSRGPTGARWATASAIVDSGFGSGTDRTLYREAEHVRLLLVDDLGWGPGIEKIFALMSTRHGNELPTIWTTNMRFEDFVTSAIGQPLISRLGDDGWLCALTERWA